MLGVDYEAELGRLEAHVAVLRTEQARLVAEATAAQRPLARGHRSAEEWLAGTLDVSHRTARRLVELTRVDGATWTDVADGEITLDRALAERRLTRCGVGDEVRRRSRDWDIDGVRRLAARHRRLRPVDEQEAFARRYFTMQPNLDESLWRLDGLLPGIEAQVLQAEVARRADELPVDPDGRAPVGQRQADALVDLVLDGAAATPEDTGGERLPMVATVLVDAALAAPTFGRAGGEVVGGTRVGPAVLEEILCSGRVEVDVTGAQPLGIGPTTHAIPPRLRRYVITRDGGMCAVRGCRSRHRLQVHHRTPISRGGTKRPRRPRHLVLVPPPRRHPRPRLPHRPELSEDPPPPAAPGPGAVRVAGGVLFGSSTPPMHRHATARSSSRCWRACTRLTGDRPGRGRCQGDRPPPG